MIQLNSLFLVNLLRKGRSFCIEKFLLRSFFLIIIIIIIFFSYIRFDSLNKLKKAENIFFDTVKYEIIWAEDSFIESYINWNQKDYYELNNLFKEKKIAGYCGLVATYLAKKFNNAGLKSFTMNIGKPVPELNDNISHVIVVLNIYNNYYVFDPTYEVTFKNKNNSYMDLFDVLNGKNYLIYNFPHNLTGDKIRYLKEKDKIDKDYFNKYLININPSQIQNKDFYLVYERKNYWINNEDKKFIKSYLKPSNVIVEKDAYFTLIKLGLFGLGDCPDKKTCKTFLEKWKKTGLRIF